MIDLVLTWLSDVGGAFLNPQKRVFLGYLASAFVVALLAACLAAGRMNGWKAGARRFLDPSVWFARSARADYLIVFINRAVLMLLAPRLVTHSIIASALFLTLHDLFAGLPLVDASGAEWLVIAGFTLTLFLVDDFSRYLVHMLLHKSSLLWPFHKVHHSAEVLNPVTALRLHPMGHLLSSVCNGLTLGALNGLLLNLYAGEVAMYAIFGSNGFALIYCTIGLYHLKHSHVWISYPRWLGRLIQSPSMHFIHHSDDPKHYDKNFGFVFTFWDQVFGSFYEPREEERDNLIYGISEREGRDEYVTVRQLYLTPFRRAWAYHLRPAIERVTMRTPAGEN